LAVTIAWPGRPYPAAGQHLLAALRAAHDVQAGLTAIHLPATRLNRLPAGWEGPAAVGQRRVRVFVSYAHAPAAHKIAVNLLADLLIMEGIDVRIDTQYDRRPRDWSLWITRQLRKADYVLVMASPEYRRRAEGSVHRLEGRGVAFEAFLLRNAMYEDPVGARQRILPVLLPGMSWQDIPEFLGPSIGTYARVTSLTRAGVGPLLYVLTGRLGRPRP
jgi:hypothetical protein